MNHPKMFVSILESVYLIYMYNFFETKYSFHHPFELFITGNFDYLKHPINSGVVESKICSFGKHASYIGAMYLIVRLMFTQIYKLNTKIVFSCMIISFFMNINSFIYLLPIFFVELEYISNY